MVDYRQYAEKLRERADDIAQRAILQAHKLQEWACTAHPPQYDLVIYPLCPLYARRYRPTLEIRVVRQVVRDSTFCKLRTDAAEDYCDPGTADFLAVAELKNPSGWLPPRAYLWRGRLWVDITDEGSSYIIELWNFLYFVTYPLRCLRQTYCR